MATSTIEEQSMQAKGAAAYQNNIMTNTMNGRAKGPLTFPTPFEAQPKLEPKWPRVCVCVCVCVCVSQHS